MAGTSKGIPACSDICSTTFLSVWKLAFIHGQIPKSSVNDNQAILGDFSGARRAGDARVVVGWNVKMVLDVHDLLQGWSSFYCGRGG